MTTTSLQADLLKIIYYKAPANLEIRPYVIDRGMEVVEIVTHGVVYFHSGEIDLKLGCGALFWHTSGEETIHRTEAGAPYECLALEFSVKNQSRSLRRAPRLSVIPDAQRTRELCRELLRSYHDNSIDRTVLGNYAYARLLWETHLGLAQNAAELRPRAIEMALSFLEAGFHRPEIGVEDLAEAAGISEPHLHVLFRKHLEQTPHQALTLRRIQEAKWLLSGTFQTIKAISLECGFLNIETFYRSFKKTVGLTPDYFRKSHRSPLQGEGR